MAIAKYQCECPRDDPTIPSFAQWVKGKNNITQADLFKAPDEIYNAFWINYCATVFKRRATFVQGVGSLREVAGSEPTP